MEVAVEAHSHPDPGPIVPVTINGRIFQVHRGRVTVVELKQIGGVPLAYELEQVVAGQLQTLPDNGAVTIKGDEVFIGRPRDGASS